MRPAAGSPLHDAARQGLCADAARLLAEGADPSLPDAAGHAPLDLDFEYCRSYLDRIDALEDPARWL